MATNYKDRAQLKDEVYKLAIENIERAKEFYNRILPAPNDPKAMDLITVNGQQINESMRVINENLVTLVKLYAEINKEEESKLVDNTKTTTSDIYKVLDQISPANEDRIDALDLMKEEEKNKEILSSFNYKNS